MDNKPYVFISYAHLDSEVVLSCVDAMKRSGINLWYDEGIEAGSEWPEFIAEKVVSCNKFVLFISKAYLNSQNCKRELNFAISRKKDILSVVLEDVELSPGMEMQLGTYQAIYRKRFDNVASFRNSLCQEGFFNPCRTGAATTGSNHATPKSTYQEQPRTIRPSAEVKTNTNDFLNQNFNQFYGGNTQPAVQTPAPPTTTPYANVDSYAGLPAKSRIVAAILAILLGSFGIHKFYLQQNRMGILYLVFFWTYIPGIIGFIEGIMMLLSTDDTFARKYRCRPM